MRRTTGMLALVSLLAALLILAGCGVTAGTNSTATSGTITPLASPTASTAPVGAKIVQGLVTVAPAKAQFTPMDAIIVDINNGLSQSIFVADHQTSCSLVTLELQSAGGGWQALGPCRVMTPTGMVEIPSGSTNPQEVIAPSQPPAWPTGTYRVRLAYTLQRLGPMTIVYSGLFTVS